MQCEQFLRTRQLLRKDWSSSTSPPVPFSSSSAVIWVREACVRVWRCVCGATWWHAALRTGRGVPGGQGPSINRDRHTAPQCTPQGVPGHPNMLHASSPIRAACAHIAEKKHRLVKALARPSETVLPAVSTRNRRSSAVARCTGKSSTRGFRFVQPHEAKTSGQQLVLH